MNITTWLGIKSFNILVYDNGKHSESPDRQPVKRPRDPAIVLIAVPIRRHGIRYQAFSNAI